ncbi:hypothetical protein ACLOJK_036035 [Asimina triloba]
MKFSFYCEEILTQKKKTAYRIELKKVYFNISGRPDCPVSLDSDMAFRYIGVGDRNEHQLFYYFVESEGNPKEDPLVLWLTGGPGCSAWSGLVYEIGPLYFEYALYNGTLPSLKLREYPWTKISSVIFVDSPVGTGFSFSSGSKDYVLDDIKTAKEVYQFLIKVGGPWLIAHQEFLSNPLYIAGDSYCGLILPVVVNEIANGIEAGKEPIVNLKGYSLGNPLTDILIDKSSFVPYAHGMGLIPDELYQSAKKSCGEVYARPRNVECSKDIEAVNAVVDANQPANIAGLEEGQILEPKCPHASPKPFTVGPGRLLDENSRALRLPDILPGLGCRSYWYLLSHYWANDGSVRKAIGIPKGKIREWERCVKDLPYEASLMSSVNYHIKLTSRGYRALIYSGDHDLKVSFVGTLQWIKSLNFSIVSEWRPWMVDGQIAGEQATQLQSTSPRSALQCCNAGFPTILSKLLSLAAILLHSASLQFQGHKSLE